MTIIVDQSTVKRINALREDQAKPNLHLRVRVEGGGCSGFQYKLELTEEKNKKDLVFDNAVLSDDISMPFLEGATVLFEEGLIGSEFVIKNPNATAGCGCGTSFSVI